jgi:hypothetical protein
MAKNKKIETFNDLYFRAVEPNSFISSFVSGHLMIEFLLVRISEIKFPNLTEFAESLSYYKLVHLISGVTTQA